MTGNLDRYVDWEPPLTAESISERFTGGRLENGVRCSVVSAEIDKVQDVRLVDLRGGVLPRPET